ncbi:MAG: hypothetical protein IIC39_07785 [Candidatus Marinimicrobia bacterium]|nr:hypothetical protein [Candidatus Neomarinimicrobiota bacterium]TFB11210.1 hypothetical protein E3V36_01610 [Candidatus Marinimicrobia bacterium MT.SAG.2]
MKSEKEVRVSLGLHREALSYTKEEFKERLIKIKDEEKLDIDPDDEVVIDRLYKEMQHIERSIIRELEWILEDELKHSDDWVNEVLSNL